MKKISKILCTLMCAMLILCSLSPVLAAGNGMTFSRNSIYVAQKAFDRTPNTIEAWVKLREANIKPYSIISNYGEDTYPCIAFEIINGNPSLLWGDPNYVHSYTFDKVNLLNDEWTHVTVVRDYESGEARCYVNGELAQTLTMYTTAKELICSPFAIGSDKREFNSQAFVGRLRSVAVYDSVRTPEQISADMTSPEKCDSLIAHYEPESGDTIADKSGNGYDAVKTSAHLSSYVEPDQIAHLEDYDYTFAVLGDTQMVTEVYPNDFPKIYDWILNNKESKNIQFVMGLGDITNKSTDKEWKLAMENIDRMLGVVPFSIPRGNHDTVASYNKYVPFDTYKVIVDGAYNNTMLNTYKKFTIGERKFLLFALDFGPSAAVLNWASEVVEAHPDHNVIITTHAYIFRDGEFHDASKPYPPSQFGGVLNGDQIWDKFVRKHENIVMVLCGHTSTDGVLLRHDVGDNGNIITTLLINPQDIDTSFKGLGMVATLHLNENDNNVQVRYYSTIKEKYFCKSAQYSFKLDFIGEDYSAGTNETPSAGPESTATAGNAGNSEFDPTVIIICCVAVMVIAIGFAVFKLAKIYKKK